MIDFSAVERGELKIGQLAPTLTLAELVEATNEQLDAFVTVVRDLSDDEINFIATDPGASADGETTGWNVAHVIVHFTASSEEAAAVSSILARGIPYPFEPRLRIEAEWTELTTVASCLQRLAESRRIQLAYLNAWPDTPRLDVARTLPEAFAARVGTINAVGSALLGLMHGNVHLAHVREIARQARMVLVR